MVLFRIDIFKKFNGVTNYTKVHIFFHLCNPDAGENVSS